MLNTFAHVVGRRLIGHRRHDERGASLVLVGLLMTTLVGAAGLSIDTGSMVYNRARLQTAADSAALAIAQDCVLNKTSCTNAGAVGTASYYVTQNAGSGSATVPGGATAAGGTVTVKTQKTLSTPFFGALGVKSKNLSATAKATWAGHPTEGTTMLPMAVPYCIYKNNLPPSTTPVLLRSDAISVVFNVIVQGGTLGRVITTLLGDLTGVTEACTSSTGLNLKMIRGPIWLSGMEGAVNGAFNWNSSVCNMHLGTIDGFLGSTASAIIPSNCVNRLGTMIKKGQIITIPIYEPSMALDKLGLELDGCLLGICSAKIPPRIGVKVLGFAPFKVTGWNYPNNVNLDPNAPACADITLLTHPPASVGCQGIQGYFLKNLQRDPDFTYNQNGVDLGASDVRLSE